MVTCHFKIRINGAPLAGCFMGETTGLDSALQEFNKRLRHADFGDVIELVAYDNGVKTILKRDSK